MNDHTQHERSQLCCDFMNAPGDLARIKGALSKVRTKCTQLGTLSPSTQIGSRVQSGAAQASVLLPYSFDIFITARCNSHCRFCSVWTNSQGDLELAHIRKLFREIRAWTGVRTEVNLLGGEPTFRDDFIEILESAREFDIQASCTSNGYRFADLQFTRRVVATGLRSIVFSLDGLERTHDYLRGKGRFAQALAGLRHFRELDPTIHLQVQSLICKSNQAELLDLLEYLRGQQLLDSCSFQALAQDFSDPPAADWYLRHPLWPDDLAAMDRLLDQLHALKLQGSLQVNNPALQFALWKQYFRDPNSFKRVRNGCLIGDVHLGCDCSGEIKLCPYRPPVGNIKATSLQDIFLGNAAVELRTAHIYPCEKVCHYLINCGFEWLQINPNLSSPGYTLRGDKLSDSAE